MSNNLSDRVNELIEEAGGRAAFIERVWPGRTEEAEASNRAKLSKWAGDKSGMSLGEIEHVADKFGVRRAWLLWGELPERPDVSRNDAQLENDLAARVASEAIARAGPTIDAAFREHLRRIILGRGSELLQILVDTTADQVRANEAGYAARLQGIQKNSPIRKALLAAAGIDGEQFEIIMRALYSHPPLPSGSVITWESASPASAAAPVKKRPKPRKRARVRRST